MNHHAEIEKLCLFMGEGLIGAIDGENVLSRGETLDRIMEEEGSAVIGMKLRRIGVDHHRGHFRHEVDRLADDVFKTGVLRIFVIAVHGQHRAGNLVHDVGARGVHDHLLRKPFGKLPVRFDDFHETAQIIAVGQIAEQKQPADLFKEKPVLGYRFLNDFLQVDAPVHELSVNRDNRSVFRFLIADDITDVGKTGQNSGAVGVSEAPLDAETLAGLHINFVIAMKGIA